MKIVVTGGLGFIGSAVVRRLIEHTEHTVLNVDKRTYAATDGSVAAVAGSDPSRQAALYRSGCMSRPMILLLFCLVAVTSVG